MSHRAYVAVPSRKDTGFDIYPSHNGGEDFRLYSALQDYDRETLDRLQQLPSQVLDGMLDAEALSNATEDVSLMNTARDQPIISEEPLGEEYQRDEIFLNLDYLTRDVLYLVTSDSVDVYFLSWSGITQQSLLAGRGTLKVYPRPGSLSEMPPEKEDPYYEFKGDAFYDTELATQKRNDAPPLQNVVEALARDHMTIYTPLIQAAFSGQPKVETVGIADYTYIFEGRPEGSELLQLSRQQGVAINSTPHRVSPDMVFRDVRNRANKLRWYHNQKQGKKILNGSISEDWVLDTLSEFNRKNREQFGDINEAQMTPPPTTRELV